MSISVGTLIVDLQANTASFVSGMDKAGQIALTSTKNIKKAFEEMAAGLGAAVVAAEAALAELVDRSIENSARLFDMAQSTGVSTAALSGLEYAAKQSGVSTEALDKGANGQLRPTQDVLADLAEKFAALPDGPLKTASAIAIFGKAGAELVPLLNRGKEGITDLIAEAKRLGIVIDDDTAAAAKKFEESMNKLKAAVDGAGNKLTASLLPQMQLVIDTISAGAEESNSRFSALLAAAAFIGKAFVVAFGGVQTFFDSLGEEIHRLGANLFTAFGSASAAVTAALKGHWAEAVQDMKDGNSLMEANDRDSADKQTKIWKDYGDGVVEFWNKTVDKVNKKPLNTTGNQPKVTNKPAENFEKSLEEHIAKLQAQADAEGRLANAIKGTTDATIVATSAAEAQKTIDDLNAQGKKVGVQVTQQQAEAIQVATLRVNAYKSALEDNKQLEAQIVKTKEAITSTKELADAYLQGAAAIEAAQEKSKLTPFAKQVSDLQNLITTLKGLGATDKQLAPLQSALVSLKQKFDSLADSIHQEAAAQETLKLNEATNQMNIQIASLQGYSKAVLEGADALRQFNVEQQVAAFQRANPNLDANQLEQYRQEVQKVSDAEQERATAQKIAGLANLGNIQDQINQLNKFKETHALTAQQQIAYDAIIHDLELQKQKDLDTLLLKTDSVTAGFKAWFDEFTNDGVTSAQKVFSVMNTAIQGLENNLAQMITTGKAKWSDYVNSILQELQKLALNALFKQLLGLGLGALNNSDFFSSLGGGNIFGSGGIFGGGRAGGGDVSPGTIYEVGEQGKELFVPRTAGTIVPNGRTVNTKSGGVTNIFNQHFDINASDADSFRASQGQIAATGWTAARRAAGRN
jgi:lambda family phage tail tape measure protein